MARYLIDYCKPIDLFNGSVARLDVRTTLKELGTNFIDLKYGRFINVPKIRGLMIRAGYARDVYKTMRNISLFPDDYVYFQYPFTGTLINHIINIIHSQGANVVFIVHDLEFLRYNKYNRTVSKNIRLLNKADVLFVHTDKMLEKLKNLGVNSNMIPINLFDYYTKDDFREIDNQILERNVIAFAGNLNKSEVFVRKLQNSIIPKNYFFNLYGSQPNYSISKPQIRYEGKFLSDHTASIHAGWGLVWDGDSIDTCSGSLGEYLKIISPHKLSLYIAAGIPVVVWNESAHAEFVKSNHIGVVVKRISDLYDQIANISEEQYREMISRVRKIGLELRRGEFLKNAVRKVENIN